MLYENRIKEIDFNDEKIEKYRLEFNNTISDYREKYNKEPNMIVIGIQRLYMLMKSQNPKLNKNYFMPIEFDDSFTIVDIQVPERLIVGNMDSLELSFDNIFSGPTIPLDFSKNQYLNKEKGEYE